MQKHSEKIFSQFAFNKKSKIKSIFLICITSVLQPNNISPIFSIENILFA